MQSQKKLELSITWYVPLIWVDFWDAKPPQVGPLPPTPSTKTLPLDYCFNSDRNFVPDPIPDQSLLLSWLVTFGVNSTDVLQELLGGVCIQHSGTQLS